MRLRSACLYHKRQRNFLLLLLLQLLLPSLILAFSSTPISITTLGGVQAFSSPTITRLSSLTKPTTTIALSRLHQSKENDDDTPPPAKQQQQDTTTSMHPALQLLGKTTSTVVAGTFFIVLAWKRDALMVSFFIGAISNGILSKVLKKLIRQERPMEEYVVDNNTKSLLESPPPSDNGMPSSHAMSLGFIGTFTGLYFMNPYLSLALVAYATISLWYRIETKLHTWEQVAVGATVGTTNAIVWRCLCFGTTQPFQLNPPPSNSVLPIHFMDFVTNHFLNEQGLLPLYGLAIPAILGALIVGSVERRIGQFVKRKKEEKEAGASTNKQA